MKTYLGYFCVMLFCIITLTTNAQTEKQFNFKIENNLVIWQKVFENKLSLKEITDIINRDNKFNNVKLFDSTIVFTYEKLTPDIKGAGYSRGSTPFYILDNLIKQDITIEFRKGRYRVTCKNILCVQQRTLQIGYLSSANGKITAIETVVINRKGELKEGITAYGYEILDYSYTKELNFESKIAVKNDNW